VQTYPARDVVVHPTALASEALPLDVDQQKALTARLLAARPLYRQLGDSASVEALCEVVSRHSTGGVRFTSSGPSANDVVSVERGSTSSLGR